MDFLLSFVVPYVFPMIWLGGLWLFEEVPWGRFDGVLMVFLDSSNETICSPGLGIDSRAFLSVVSMSVLGF